MDTLNDAATGVRFQAMAAMRDGAEVIRAAANTVHHDAATPSFIKLPVLPQAGRVGWP